MTGTERRILVCGDRRWTERGRIYTVLSALRGKSVTIIHGAARGADTLAGDVAGGLGFIVVPVPADWAKYGRAAGPIRNRQMLDMQPDLVIAFHHDLPNSKGTKDCVLEARRRGIPVDTYGSVLPL